jgi:hypothetical protein
MVAANVAANPRNANVILVFILIGYTTLLDMYLVIIAHQIILRWGLAF